MFALPVRPKNPELQPGELLLLQLVKEEMNQQTNLIGRINFALIFDHLERDHDGSLSRLTWPTEGRVWDWILYASATVPTIPFSLEDLSLSNTYRGQTNPRLISSADEKLILPFIQWSLAATPQRDRQLIDPSQVATAFGGPRTLAAIYNHDRIALSQPPSKRVVLVENFDRNPALADSLKSYYDYHCQVCDFDFRPRFGQRVADTHHIQYLRDLGLDISTNMIVLCPNHHRVVHAADARFDRKRLEYEFPNGLREKLLRPDHLRDAPQIIVPEPKAHSATS